MFSALMKKRRSIRAYADRPVEKEKVEIIIEAALRSPSGRAARPWSFVVVTGKSLLGKLSVARPQGAAFVKEAPLAIVVCGDPGETPAPYKKEELRFDKVSYNCYEKRGV
jgi:nitroreductase